MFRRQKIYNDDYVIQKVTQALAETAEAYGMTMDEAAAVINQLSNLLQMSGYGIPESYAKVLNELRPAMAQKTENPNQKSDLEIFEWNGINAPDKRPQAITITAENSQWDTNLLDEYFPHWRDPNAFSTEPYLKEEFQIRYDDDWIREILEEV